MGSNQCVSLMSETKELTGVQFMELIRAVLRLVPLATAGMRNNFQAPVENPPEHNRYLSQEYMTFSEHEESCFPNK